MVLEDLPLVTERRDGDKVTMPQRVTSNLKQSGSAALFKRIRDQDLLEAEVPGVLEPLVDVRLELIRQPDESEAIEHGPLPAPATGSSSNDRTLTGVAISLRGTAEPQFALIVKASYAS